MLQSIVDAVQQRLLIRFLYKGSWREVEPLTYGLSLAGDTYLSGWQRSGGSGVGFRLFFADQLSSMSVIGDFDEPQLGYVPGDYRFGTIYAEL